MNWQVLLVVSNSVITLAYLGISAAILVPLLRSGQVRSNRLGTATAAIFFSCAVGHGLHANHAVTGELDRQALLYSGIWDAITAAIGVYYWSLRGVYGSLMQGATLFEDLREQQRVQQLEADQRLAATKAEAQRQVQVQAEMLRSVLASSQSLVYIKDLEGRFLLVNDPLQEAFGLAEDEILGQDGSILDPANAAAWRQHDLWARSGPIRVEEQARTRDGLRYFDSRKFPLHDAEGLLYATGGVSLDVTASRQAAEDLAVARDDALAAAEAKSAFLATMSHEIRTPMNAVIGMTGVLLDTDLDREQREYVDIIRSSGDALLELINDILDFSKIEAGELEIDQHPFDPVDLVEQSLDLVAAGAAAKGLELACQIDPAVPRTLVGDPTRLRQVLVNLLSNAVKFTETGDVVVTLRVAGTDSQGRVRVVVEVRDTGIGIPSDVQHRMFQPFSQADASTTRLYGGTGLGLAICRRLVEAMDGALSLDSTPGQGSTFTVSVRLPVLTSPDGDGSATARSDADLPLAGSRALVLIPHPVARERVSALLQSWGARCTSAAQLAGAAREGEGYDLAVLDLRGDPHGVASPTAALQEAGCRRIIAISAVGTRLPESERARLSAVLTAPVKEPALRAAVTADPTPARVPGQTRRSTAATEAGTDPARLRILLAEDNLVNQKVSKLLLHQIPEVHTVDVVCDGSEALEAVHRHRYDIVLMDVQMPNLDGLEATRRIRAELDSDRQPKIIAMTASALASDQQACRVAGMDGYVSKPVRGAELREVLLAARGRFAHRRPTPGPTTAGPAMGSDSAGADQALPVLDLDALIARVEDLGDDGGLLRDVLLESLREECRAWIPRLASALRAGDWRNTAWTAHRLRSSCRQLGASRLHALLTDLEEKAGHRIPLTADQAGQIAERVRDEGEQLVAAVSILIDVPEPVAMPTAANSIAGLDREHQS